MAKDPAFLFYPNDYIGGTMGMTFEEKGAYMELLMLQFNRGHMTTHMIGQTIGQLFGQIKDKFKKDENGLWYNERLELEKERRKDYVSSRTNNRLGVNQFSKKDEIQVGHMTKHTTGRMEDVDKDINIKEHKNKEQTKELSTLSPLLDDASFRVAWLEHRAVRQKKKGALTPRADKHILVELEKLCKGDKQKAIAILDQSSRKGWVDVFELKEPVVPLQSKEKEFRKVKYYLYYCYHCNENIAKKMFGNYRCDKPDCQIEQRGSLEDGNLEEIGVKLTLARTVFEEEDKKES